LNDAVVQVATEGGAARRFAWRSLVSARRGSSTSRRRAFCCSEAVRHYEDGDAGELVVSGEQGFDEGGDIGLKAALDQVQGAAEPAMDEPGGKAERGETEDKEEHGLVGIVGDHVGEQRAGVAEPELVHGGGGGAVEERQAHENRDGGFGAGWLGWRRAEGDGAFGEGAELRVLGGIPEAGDDQPATGRLVVAGLVGGMDRSGAHLQQAERRVGEEMERFGDADSVDEVGGGECGQIAGGEGRAEVTVDFA
jgi:hypothetical protein